MAKYVYKLDDAGREAAKKVVAEWCNYVFRTGRMTPREREAVTDAVEALYRAGGLEPPPRHRIVIAPSPMVARFAAGAAAWIWYCRDKGRAATRAATDDATDAATYAATYDATAATDAATDDATRAATDDATDAATRAATDAATDAATYAATYATTYATTAATYAATHDATDAATRAATAAATDAATRAATYDATADATYAATDDDLSRWFTGASGCVKAVSALAKEGGIRCAQLAYRLYQGGSAWAYVQAAIAFGRDHAKLAEHGAVSQAQYDKYAPWETLAKLSGFRFMHAKFCIVADRPLEYHIDDRHRPHCETGPFVRWADGSAFYSVHGVRVPAWVIEKRDTLTVAQIMAEDNAEVRRVMIGLYGRERFFSDAGAHVIEHLGEDYPVAGLRDARLLKLSVRGDDDWTMIDLRDMAVQPDGSKRRYMFRVNPAFYGGDAGRLVHAAAASIHRRPDDRSALYYRDWRDYAPAVET